MRKGNSALKTYRQLNNIDCLWNRQKRGVVGTTDYKIYNVKNIMEGIHANNVLYVMIVIPAV